jgi:copper chaperone NosL
MRFLPALQRFHERLERPILPWARGVLILLVIPLALAFVSPLWRISLGAPQYPKGLYLDIYAYKIEGGNGGQHLKEINNLNHYIGMRSIDRAELSDLDWMPFAMGALGLLALRCAAVGKVRSLVDLTVVTSYVGLFAMGRFAYKLWVFGHTLDPGAPLRLPPFTPPLFGTKQIANFSSTSLPQLGAIWIGVFVAGLGLLTLWHLLRSDASVRKAEGRE